MFCGNENYMQAHEDLIPVAIVVVGGTMVVIIMLLHGLGLELIVARYKRRAAKLRKESGLPRRSVFAFAGTIFLMLLLHITEIEIWGFALHGSGLVNKLHEAVYFSANAYTTLGEGSMALPSNWHDLSPVIAISGLFAFAWTTSEMFHIVGEQHDLRTALSANRQKGGESNNG
jgi:hypothetical protein